MLQVFFVCIWCPSFAGAAWRLPPDHLVLEMKGAYVPGSYGTLTPKNIVLSKLPLQGTARQQTETDPPPSVSVNEAHLLVVKFVPEAQPSAVAHLEA